MEYFFFLLKSKNDKLLLKNYSSLKNLISNNVNKIRLFYHMEYMDSNFIIFTDQNVINLTQFLKHKFNC